MAIINVGKNYTKILGNDFKKVWFSGALTHSLDSANPLILKPRTGRAIRLVSLISNTSAAAPILNTSLSGDSTGVVIDSLGLGPGGTKTDGGFSVGASSVSSSANNDVGAMRDITFNINEIATLSTETVSSTNTFYAYEEVIPS